MYDLVHNHFQKILWIVIFSGLTVLTGCVSSPQGEPSPRPDSPESEEVQAGNPGAPAEDRDAPRRSAESDSETDIETDADSEAGTAPDADGSDVSDDAPGPRERPGRRAPWVEPVLPEFTQEAAIEALLAEMSLRQRIGQMIMPGVVRDSEGNAVRAMNAELTATIEEIQPGGIVLFGPNIATAEQVRRLVGDMQSVSSLPLMISVDQEGGIVRRVVPREGMPATEIPPARAVGRLADPALAYELGRVMGRELRSLGITMNFAPVGDVQTNPDNPVIGSRSYGSDPQEVAEMVGATVRGLQAEGVSAVVKHFPGHGDTVQDSHEEAAAVPHDMARLQRVELVPFRRGIEAGADGVMIGHIAVPEVSGSPVPATLDAVLVEGILRERLGFDRLVITDSLIMDGLTRYFDADTIAVRAVQAGADILLLPASPSGAVRALEAAVDAGEISRERIDRSVRRILRAKFARGLLVVSHESREAIAAEELVPREVVMGTQEHRTLVEIIQHGERP
ncbi:MAG: glycoside hydrolase family 3 N-terminal domain-containing protein [Alkalispirochaeta sp.]